MTKTKPAKSAYFFFLNSKYTKTEKVKPVIA
jgi:hypothetical protein